MAIKPFMNENFILESEVAQSLYHDFAAKMPIIDYHCHLPQEEISIDKKFENISKIWLNGDHYKWRAMRTNGVDEKYCTGDASDFEKFEKWAETVPYTMRNPLYHWTHMELQKPFGITDILNKESARKIYDATNEKLQTKEFSVQGLLKQFSVEVICTTDDPIDNLHFHQQIKNSNLNIKVLPTFRPDKAMAVEDQASFNTYLDKLEKASNITINSFKTLIDAVQNRHDFFASVGCKLSDHGLETIYAQSFTESELEQSFKIIRSGKELNATQVLSFKSAMLYQFAIMDHAKDWTQQFHVGAIRNNNTRMQRILGADSGFDSIGDFSIAQPMAKFFDNLDTTNQLAKTIIYNLNPRDNELMATMIGNFQDGSIAGKMQFGSAWWFLDQKDGMEKQINSLSNLGLLSRFVGMLTDSRSFLSYSRHEYFRRILCNLIGKDVANGELPNDTKLLGQMVENICYHNAKNYFQF